MTILFDTVKLGPIENGKQTITLPSGKNGAYISVNTNKEKVDEYISNRKSIEKDINKKSGLLLGLGTVIGLTIGTLTKQIRYGGVIGFMASLLGILLGLPAYHANKIEKLNDKFIAANS